MNFRTKCYIKSGAGINPRGGRELNGECVLQTNLWQQVKSLLRGSPSNISAGNTPDLGTSYHSVNWNRNFSALRQNLNAVTKSFRQKNSK